MQSKTNEIDGVKYTVNAENGWHVIAKNNFWPRVSFKDDPDWDIWYDFGRVLIQSAGVETPFVWPDITDTPDELKIARDKWLALPGAIVRSWLKDLNEVDAAPSSPELAPDAPKNVEGQQ